MAHGVHLDLDGSCVRAARELGLTTVDARAWGPRLRYITSARQIDAFLHEHSHHLAPFTLLGSGDFHHLSAVWLKRFTKPLALISFDNHPDWDRRPPRWACGGWLNRALELPQVQSIDVWGCGNFELALPHRLFARRDPRLTVHPWAERFKASDARRYPSLTRETWQPAFAGFVDSLRATDVYVTIDMDCLTQSDVVTNWEQGLFTIDDLAWALAELKRRRVIVGGDIVGARSEVVCATRFQRLATWWDHPKLTPPLGVDVDEVNTQAMVTLWKALTA